MENLSNAGKYTLQFINQTNRSIFLTGKAGTGKTTLLKEIIRTTHKNVVVVAPTVTRIRTNRVSQIQTVSAATASAMVPF